MSISDGAVKAFLLVVARCDEGVDFDPERGATCPECGRKLATTTTRPFRDGLRERYHTCSTVNCLVHTLGLTIKSIEKEG